MLRKDIIKSISNSIKAEFREVLTGLPSWMVEWSIAFASSLHPQLPGEPKKPLPRQPSSSSKMPSIIEPDMTDHSTASESFQSFYGALEDELLEKEQQSDHLSEKKADGRLTYNPAQEDRRYQMVERVERAVCALFYDQLFRRKPSDDASHDEALSSRIAALNMLDLGLEHLGIDIGKAGNGLQAVVTSVGQALQRLQDPSCRAPVDKAAAMVAAHNVAVEGLSRLPPIRLKPDEEMLAEEPTPLASQFKQNVNVSGDGEKASLKSPLTTLPEDKPVELLSPTLDPTSPSVISGPDVSTLQSPTSEGDDTTKRTPVASDILLPFMIYSIVKTNPPELVSHLLYTQRYRMRSHSPSSGAGEEAFCLINLLAAVEFLENVDLAALGLADSSRVLSVADLAPLPLSPNALTETGGPDSPLASPAAKLRGRVNQQVEELAGSANKVLSGVVDSSFLALKGLLSNNNVPEKTEGSVHSPSSMVSPNEVPPWNLQRPGFGDDHGNASVGIGGAKSDVRSIRSFGSMMSGESRDRRSVLATAAGKTERLSLSDRLANVSVRSRLGKDTSSFQAQSPPSKRASLLGVSYTVPNGPSSRPTSPSFKIPGPNERFMECDSGDLKLSEVGELLIEYRRVVEGLRALGGFDEPE
ncbi:hypothetical protein FRC20_010664 [Serendipita sp. 405]|nr:hypothetical protein FRC20_010664 [Serendipita sp. 405]